MVAPVAASTPIGWAYAGISAISSLFSSSSERRRRRKERIAKETQYGIKSAGIDFTIQRQLSFIPEQSKAIQENASIAEQAVNAAQAKTEADIRVNAAVAGVSGTSVDLSISDTERTASKNRLLINDKENKQLQQLQIDITDFAVSKHTDKGVLINNTKSSRTADYGLAGLEFLSSYLSKI